MIYNYIDENMPQWARATVQKLVDKGYLNGNEKGELGLNDTMLQKYKADSARLWVGHADDLPSMIIGSVVGTHAGPGAIGVAFFGNE